MGRNIFKLLAPAGSKHYSRKFFLAFLLLFVAVASTNKVKAIGFGGGVTFQGPSPVTMYTCQGGSKSLDSLLGVSVSDGLGSYLPDSLIWHIVSLPSHGTISGVNQGAPYYTGYSGPTEIFPTGTVYTPDFGFSGIDSFQVVVYDTFSTGVGTSYMMIQVVVEPTAPDAGAIFGDSMICMGATTGTLHDTLPAYNYSSSLETPITLYDGTTYPSAWSATFSGTWSSSNPAVATVTYVDSMTTVINTVGPGTATISYTFTNDCGTATVTKTITVLPVPAAGAVTGTSGLCTAGTTTLHDATATAGGTWTSSAPTVATVGASSGVVYGATVGSSIISYSDSNICGVFHDTMTVTVSSGASTGVISGLASLCAGDSSLFTTTGSGGFWSTGSSSVATVSIAGKVFGAGAGTTLVYYTVTGACGSSSASWALTVNPLVSAGTVTGSAAICTGVTDTLVTSGTTGGVWTTTAGTIATIVSVSGDTAIISGLTSGNATISYTVSGCGASSATLPVTVFSAPTAITGSPTFVYCQGVNDTFYSTPAGGTWSSSSSLATIGAANGHIHLSSTTTGTCFITYSIGGCYVTQPVTVNIQPLAFTGSATVCQGATVTLTDLLTSPAGTWSVANPSIATIVSTGTHTGALTGIHWGSTIVTYSIGSCYKTSTENVDSVPLPVLGTLTMCLGTNTTLYDSTHLGAFSGTWTSGNTAVDTFSSVISNVLGAKSIGTSTVTYTVGSCFATATSIVNPPPGIIHGIVPMCVGGSSITLSDTTALSATWTSSATAIATVDTFTGVVTGVAAGVTNITYGTGAAAICSLSAPLTVNAAPLAITPLVDTICVGGSTVTLSEAVTGGTWSSSDTFLATVSTGGVVTPVAMGIDTIFYTDGVGAACQQAATINVNGTASPITGTGADSVLCVASAPVALSNATPGGVWKSSNTAVATVSATGTVYPVAPGSTTISYTLGAGAACVPTYHITVNGTPTGLTPTTPILCTGGGTVTLTPTVVGAIVGGAVWTSSNTSMATVSGTGVVSPGATTGTPSITYSDGLGAGCEVSEPITVNAGPAAITGTTPLCPAGGTFTFTDATSGGTWSSTVLGSATIVASTGVVTPIGGTTTINYTTGAGVGCVASFTLVVNGNPAAIGGNAVMCVGGSTVLLTDAAGGGTWTSSNTAIATITGGGTVTPVASGNSIITYSTGAGAACRQTVQVTVNGAPGTIVGDSFLCLSGGNRLFTDDTLGGTWSVVGVGASVGATNGIVSPTAVGTPVIKYTTGTGVACSATHTVTVNGNPAAITSVLGFSMCPLGSTLNLADATGGGIWVSQTTSVASVTSTGVATAGVPGNDSVFYETGSGSSCKVFAVLTVNPGPAAISGYSTLCTSSGLVTFNDATSGGTWISSNPGCASVGTGGVVNPGAAVAPCTATISYTTGAGCVATYPVTVNAPPTAITTVTGGFVMCAGGSTITMVTTPATGGTWTSSNTSVAQVSGTGVVTPQSTSGTATISYSTGYGTSCLQTAAVSVNTAPAPITGTSVLCMATGATTLTETTPGGTWTVVGSAVTVASGVITPAAVGTAIVSYTSGLGCGQAFPVTVNATPTPIVSTSGFFTMCPLAAPITLSDVAGGYWVSYTPAVATIDSFSGVVSPLVTGTSIISYNTGSGAGCSVGTTVTVNPAPAPIVGVTPLCTSSGCVTFTDASSGGTWSSSAGTVATINSSGVVCPAGFSSVGPVTISYTSGYVCASLFHLTVNAVPAAITGPVIGCYGTGSSPFTLTDVVSGGRWLSTNTAVATVDTAVGTTGIVTPTGVGLDTLVYSTGLGALCATRYPITVNPVPAAITGAGSICNLGTTTLTDTTTGGAWSSASTAIAIISSTGVVTGTEPTLTATPGTTTISYTKNGCSATFALTVNPQPTPLTGSSNICQGSNDTLRDSVAGGTWSSSTVSVASLTASHLVHGNSVGVAAISYSIGSCYVAKIVTVNPVAAPITGNASICMGSNTTLNDTTTGGVWSTSNVAVATVNGSGLNGIVTPNSVGTATISYTLGLCPTTKVVTVHTQPTPITNVGGSATVCQGGTRAVNSSPAGGVWSSSNTSLATVNPTTPAVVHGLMVGVDTIIYTLGGVCAAKEPMTINPTPSPIMGTLNVCLGTTDTLSDTLAGGTWTSVTPTVASISSISGTQELISGLTLGTSIVSYSLAGCYAVATVTVSTIPAMPAPITSPGTVLCAGLPYSFTNTTVGGVWSSTSPSIATVTAGGLVTGVTSGTDTISYAMINSCGMQASSIAITVNPAPNPGGIIGYSVICNTALDTLTDTGATGGVGPGVWATSNSSISTVSSSGVVTAVGAGVDTVTFTLYNAFSCYASASFVTTVNPLPFVGAIGGPSSLCVGTSITVTDTPAAGTWNLSNSTALIDLGTGIVTGVTAGIDTVSYSFTNSCGTATGTKALTVFPFLSPGVISGVPSVCVGAVRTLSESVTGGAWSSTYTSLATVNPASGAVYGVHAGIDTVKYTVTNMCGTYSAAYPVTVNPLANAGLITGQHKVCAGDTIHLSDTITVPPGSVIWSVKNAHASISSSGVLTGVSAGIDTIFYTSRTVCDTVHVSFVDTVKPRPNAGTITGLSSVCQNKTITLTDTASGGTWSSMYPLLATVSASGLVGKELVKGLAPGNDTIKYRVTNSCGVDSALFPMLVRPAPYAGVLSGPQRLCSPGASITITDTVAGGTWTLSNYTLANLTPIVNGVVISDGVGSGMADTLFYTVTNSCGTDTARLINGKLDSFYVSGLSAAGQITRAGDAYHAICKGLRATLAETASGGTWSVSNSSIATITTFPTGDSLWLSALIGGDSVTVTYTIGPCTNSTYYTMHILDSANFTISDTIINVLCNSLKTGAINVTTTGGVGPLDFVWSNGATSLNNDGIGAGTYSIVFTDRGSKCKKTDTFKVKEPTAVVVTPKIKNDTCRTANGFIKLETSGGKAPYQYMWDFNHSSSDSVGELLAGVYSVTITDSNNCMTDTVFTVLEGICKDIVVHNALTPNGDGVNDYLTIEGIQDYPENTLQIFDKWGDLVYEKKAYLNDWNGKGKNGATLPDGTYFYLVELNTVNGSGGSNTKTGYILIKH
jgi:gliding motility-associated-like protein